ncbi:YraN family protein [Leucobacter sp. CSA2]|uniref:UPF0102 protein JD292_02875 n=1 Tax=Leucobacter edaphi TaxID=2796472 RepID=A0A934UWY3_9MICO|nr:YraN family protein [Leucobacter edaphi]MBK0421026.1 YraN family protein [Leucobacter edaphi]
MRDNGIIAREDYAPGKQELGRRGEQIAADYLAARGMRILDRNWRSTHGELDLVVQDATHVIAVEVKTRSGTGYGSPLQAITPQKAARIRRTLFDWVREHKMRGAALRMDVIGIVIRAGEPPKLDYLRGIQ